MKSKLVTVLIISMFVLAFLSVAFPQVEAKADKVSITFTANGYSNYSGLIFTINGAEYYSYNLPKTIKNCIPGETFTVNAIGSFEDWNGNGYIFSSWTNGNGLIGASGTFTVPDTDITVTANYVPSTVQVKFRYSGLSNLNTITVLTVDGNEYKFNNWELTGKSFIMTIGSTHTVTASTPLTGWDGKTHYFSSWTNGNGLTGTSGTFTVPSSDITVTANYDLTQSALETVLTIVCTIDPVGSGDITLISGLLSSGGSGVAGKTITLTYYDGLAWNSIGSTTTSCDGSYTYSWTVPEELENGVYPVKADFAGDSCYLPSSATTGTLGNGGLTVLPESTWGSLVALLACFSGTLVFFKIRTRRS